MSSKSTRAQTVPFPTSKGLRKDKVIHKKKLSSIQRLSIQQLSSLTHLLNIQKKKKKKKIEARSLAPQLNLQRNYLLYTTAKEAIYLVAAKATVSLTK